MPSLYRAQGDKKSFLHTDFMTSEWTKPSNINGKRNLIHHSFRKQLKGLRHETRKYDTQTLRRQPKQEILVKSFCPFFPNSSHDRFLWPFSRVGHKVFIPDVHTLSKVKTVSSLCMYRDNKAPLNFLAYEHSLPSNWYSDHLGLGILCGSSSPAHLSAVNDHLQVFIWEWCIKEYQPILQSSWWFSSGHHIVSISLVQLTCIWAYIKVRWLRNSRAA